MPLTRRAWYLGSAAAGILCLAACVWGYETQDAIDASPVDMVIYLALPAAIFAAGGLSQGRRRRLLLTAAGLLDLEAALLGFAPLIALPFVVAVPLVSLAVSARLIAPSRLSVPYAAAWLSSSTGVAIAVLKTVSSPTESTLVVIPAFVAADAVAILMLYRLDRARLRAAQAIDSAESRARDLLNGVELFGVSVSRDSGIDFVNEHALRLTGWTREEVTGKDWWDTFATPERRESARANYKLIAAGERRMETHRESSILTRSGEVRLIRWSHVHRYGPDGGLIGVASLGEDVTAIRAAEEERRQNQELVSNLILNSPLAAAVLSLDRTVRLWNPAAAGLLGWSEQEVLGKPVPPVFLGRDRWPIARLFARAARGESPEHRLVELTRKDGQIALARFYVGTIRDRDGVPMAVSVQAVDVTAVHAMEERLREARHMEAVGRLAGGVAHDFNNSLTAIGGFAALISSATQEEETREAADTILQASRRAAQLTRELLAYSRRALLQPRQVEVNGLVRSVMPMLPSLVGDRVVVQTQLANVDGLVLVDPSGLERAILNLIANGSDRMPEGGRLTLRTERRPASQPIECSAWIVVSVEDTGPAIPPEHQAQVFDPFFTESGTGLGLAMVKGFAMQSGGQAELSSELGRGTTIEIRLPEVPAMQLAPRPEPTPRT